MPAAPELRQIKASAGSGKTYALTRHFLDLLGGARDADNSLACSYAPQGGHCWPEILAVTFTNRAAAEMKERVIRRLKEIALGIGEPAHAPWSPRLASQWMDTLLPRFGALNIRTIDSLLTMLVRLSALDLDLPPEFEPAFAGEDFFAPLMDTLLDRAQRGDTHLRDLFRDACDNILHHTNHKGFTAGDALRKRLADLLQLHLELGGLPETDPAALRAMLVTLHTEMVDSAKTLLRIMDDEKLQADKRYIAFLFKLTESHAFGKPSDSAYMSKESLDDCLNKASRGSASAEAERAFAAFAASAHDMAERGRILQRALELSPLAELTRVLAEALPEFQQREGKVPAQLVPGLARSILHGEHGVSESFCRMGTRLVHILVDEFQDTSRDQWAAILPLAVECLSRGGSLTWVGDVKQAIYSWRGGDSSLFDEVLHEPELIAIAEHPQRDTLPFNWRSREHVITWNNAVFSPLAQRDNAATVLRAMLPETTPPDIFDQAVTALQAAFAGAAQSLPDRDSSRGGYVHLARITAADKDTLADGVHDALRTRILEDIATRRPWSDVAVLVRTNPEASQVASWLMSWGVPVVTENSLRLADHPLVAQTVAMLSFLDYPANDVAFWEAIAGETLFGSFADLDRAELDDWLAEHASSTPGRLFTLFRQRFPAQWETWLAPFYARAGIMSAYDTVRELFLRFRVFQRYPADAGFLRRFLEVVHAAEEQGHTSLSTFLDFWQRTGGEEKVPMPESMDAVRVMTMHKSKGLEFPVVIIPFHHKSDVQDQPPVAVTLDGLSFLVPRCKELGPLHHKALADTAREMLHLMYVAWTRPVDELHAFITETDFARNHSTLYAGVQCLLGLYGLAPDWQEHRLGTPPPATRPALPVLPVIPSTAMFAPDHAIPHTAEHATPQTAGQEPTADGGQLGTTPPGPQASTPSASAAGHQPDAWRPMQWLPRLKIFRNQLEEFTFTQRRRGMLVHACLESLRLSGNAAADASRAVLHAMRAFPLPVPDKDAVERELTDMLTWYASCPQAAHWLRHGTPEQSILDEHGAMHRTDLLVDDGATCTVVEYKTGQPEDTHVAQVRRYLGLLGPATGKPVSGVLVYLDGRTMQTVTPASAVQPE